MDADGVAVGDPDPVATQLAETAADDDVERRGDGEAQSDVNSEGVAVDDALCDTGALSVATDAEACAV